MAKGDIKDIKEIKELKLKDNEIFLPTGEVKKISSTKLKYMKDGSFNSYQLIRKIGVVSLLTKFSDGETVLLSFIGAVLDQKPEEITWLDEATAELINEIVDKSLKINEIKDEDENFLEVLGKEVGTKE
ncbi:MAG: hypothetical protein WC389_22865 [Lutibacter sp.]|jgi:hypothetical protein